MLSPQWLDELRARVTLSGVIMRTTKLLRAGHEWKACCPFHDEKTPSFTVNDTKGFYHCFGCGAHGDVIRWMTDQRGLAFMDAIKELAAEAGMEVPRADPREAARAERRASLHDVTTAAQEWFKDNLWSAEGKGAREYLEKRGIGHDLAVRFGFGLAPDDRQAIAKALGQFDRAMLVEAGMLIEVEGKEPYARFRGRLMLPIHDPRIRIVGFGGRILDSSAADAPKYLNSPDTPLFDKGRTLYNLHRAGPVSRKTNRLIAVEGYMDVIALAGAGIEDVVAPLGTALTEAQIELLWRMVDCPVLCFDGDAAGRRAALRAALRALPLLRPGKSLAFVTLPAGLDPDDLVRREGAPAMERLLADPAGLLDTLWLNEREAAPLRTPEDKAGLKARLLAHVEAIADPDIRALYKRELLERFSAFAFPPRPPRPQPQGRWNGAAQQRLASPLAPEARNRLLSSLDGANDRLAHAVIAGLTRWPGELHRHAEALARYRPADSRLSRAVDILLDAAESLEFGESSPIKGFESLAEPPDKTRYSFLTEDSDPQAAREDLAEAVALLVDRPALEAALAAATARFERTLEDADFAEQQRLAKALRSFDERHRQTARRRAFTPAKDMVATASGEAERDEQEMD
ncbi:MAG TPA: DNA primase [Croceibacterium sp.]|nr:DNA primase [Croceibacterium sp.]